MFKKKFHDIFKSFRVRLFLLFLAVGVIPTAVLRTGLIQTYSKKAVSNRSIDVLSQAKILSNQIVFNNYLKDAGIDTINSQIEQLSNIFDGRIDRKSVV